MKIAICDDESYVQKELIGKLESYYGVFEIEVKTFQNGKEFLFEFEKNPLRFQMIFMDIEMPNMDGIEVSRRIRIKNQTVPIIILTSHIEYALDGYEIEAFRFLQKPLDHHKIFETLQSLEKRKLMEKKLDLQDGENHILLDWMDIQYIKSENVYVKIHTQDKDFLIRKKLHEIENQMPKPIFFQTHRSYIIHLKYVKSFDGKKIYFNDDVEIPISRTKRNEFKSALMKYLRFLG